MRKVLIVYNRLWPYRIPIFNLLGEQYDLTVTYSMGEDIETLINFKTKYLPGIRYSRFFVHKQSLYKICKQYDAVVGLGDISWLSIMFLLFFNKREFKIILWGIGVRASYNNRYGGKTIWDKLRFYLMRKADALLFYSVSPIKIYKEHGFDENKLFVANNTVMVDNIQNNKIRDSIIFIGTLYKEKKIYDLLESYSNAFKIRGALPKLEIIGDGDEYKNIHKWIIENNLNKNIFLRGKIFDEPKIASYFSKAIACISPGQAGLSVLKSMGYAVPFITKKNAITGGEIFNIENGQTGILYEHDSELVSIIQDIAKDKSKYIKMGANAKHYYNKCRKPIDMANEISRSIEYVCNI